MKKITHANKLSDHFDNNWTTQKSRIREIRTERLNYSPTYSWNAESDDPISFSKLNADQLPVQTTRPCTLSGTRIIELESSGGLDVLNGTAQRPNGSVAIALPLNPQQVDAGMIETDLSGNIPFVSNAIEKNQNVMMKNNYAFQNFKIQPPQFVAAELPSYYHEAGPNGDQKLLNPAQRRKIMEIDSQALAAKQHLGQAVTDRHKLKTSLTGPVHHRGVLMVDSSDNLNSEIYGERAASRHDQFLRTQLRHEQRQQNLIQKSGQLSKDYNHLIPENRNENKLFQTKKNVGSTLTFEETFTRVFEKDQLKPPRPERTQHLRDQDLLGKNFNIITNTVITHGKSSIPEKIDKVLAHPSQQSLNSTRNLQGSLRPI
jgi:hypothetical protein